MSDWQVGDRAVLAVAGTVECETCVHKGGNCPPKGAVREVVAMGPSIITSGPGAGNPCGCVTLYFKCGAEGVSQRFRKIRPDEHEPCEEEFVTLLNRTKRKVSAEKLELDALCKALEGGQDL